MLAIAALVLAALLSAAFTPLAAAAARRLQLLDRPRGYKAHADATPLLGGVAVIAAGGTAFVACALCAGVAIGANLRGLALGVLVMVLAGLYDDCRALGPLHKLGWQVMAVFAGGMLAIVAGARLELFLDWPRPMLQALTLAWLLTVTNAFNFMDNMNGLCAGLAAIGALALGIVNWLTGQTAIALLACALAGACLGFLPYNYPRARIFLGDAGSMGIGFCLAALAVLGVYTAGATLPGLALTTPLLALAIPLLDLILVVAIRTLQHRPAWRGDRAHLSHRLVRRGLAPRRAVAVLWLWALAFALLGLIAHGLPPALLVPFTALVGLLLLALAIAAGWRGLD